MDSENEKEKSKPVNGQKEGKEKKKQIRSKRDKYMPEAAPIELPPCKICGRKSSGNHYGVVSCEACKGFFRRYLLRKVPYKCKHSGNCDEHVAKTSSNPCSACRLQKCLQAGMCKEGIRQGRYTATERASAIEEMRKMKMKSVSTSTNTTETDSLSSTSGQSMSEEIPHVSSLSSDIASSTCEGSSPVDLSVNSTSVRSHSTYHNVCSQNDKPSDEETANHQISHAAIITPQKNLEREETFHPEDPDVNALLESLMKGYEELKPTVKFMTDEEINRKIQEGKKFLEKVEVFGNMDPIPADIYSEIHKSTNIDIDGRLEVFQVLREELKILIPQYVRFTHGILGFVQIPPNDQATLLKAARLEFFLLLGYRSFDIQTKMMVTYTGHVYHIRQFYPYLSAEMSETWLDITKDVHALNLTSQEHATMLALCLTFTDRCTLEAHDEVEIMQNKLMKLMQFLLKKHRKDKSGVQLGRIMNVFVKIRQLNEEFLNFYQEMCKDQLIQKYMPELLHFLID